METATDNMSTTAQGQLYVTNDLTEVRKMYEAQNMTRGIAKACLSQEEANAVIKAQKEASRPQPRTYFIPPTIYREFDEESLRNEEV